MMDEASGELSPDAAIEQLRNLIDDVDENDLPRLAKMHALCEGVANLKGDDADAASDAPCEAAKELTVALEGLILGEVEDAAAAMAAVRESVLGLGRAVVSQPSAEADDVEQPAPSDEEVAAQLDRVFGDDAAAPKVRDDNSEPATKPEEKPAPAADTQAPSGDVSEASAAPPYVSEELKIDDSELELAAGFIEEAGEHIDAIEAAVLEVERDPESAEAVDSLFRPFHTIKGAAGFLNLRDIVSLTHEAETLLDQARKGSRKVTPGLIDLVFEVVDVLKAQFAGIQAYLADPTGGAITQPPVEAMIGNLRDVVAGRIEPVGNLPAAGDPDKKLGENLVEQGAVPREVVDFAVAKQASGSEPKKVGEALMEMGVASPKQISQSLRAQAPPEPRSSTKSAAVQGERSVRIDTAKLDALVDMVGELVIAQTQVCSNGGVNSDPKLIKDVTHTTKIVRDVQDAAMAMRMIPIGPTFQKMARLVRDVSRKVGKSVELTVRGEETELDKNVIQLIGDPLVHMVRNAVDHGIESGEERRAAGKPEAGHVELSASHQGGNIVIQITDDGKGLDPAVLIEKGIEKGVVQPDEKLTDEQAFNLIFAPGFSTAQAVTGVSGRGVGMDVVRRNIESLRGKVDIKSRVGEGSTFSIRLPLTLAIIDGMVLRVGNERFIIQTVSVEKALRPTADQITTVQGDTALLNVRGRLIPLVQLGPLFGLGGPVDPCEAMVVLSQYAGGEIGLVVEELIGQQQVVIKSLGERFKGLRGISGAAILGDGRVGLILEASGIAAAHNADRRSKNRSRSGPGAECTEAVGAAIRPADVGNENLSTEEHLTPA